ncbi:4-hydroxy-tetrahydrodipicolinate reductase [Geotoga petraea]|jgi:4-hydroxy-tetrahydrodipicolinate reductase|uniref:4-hydroxy-tetrahydrodipicolinate reductase n=1 Tax=Geotoga petraea TaxID=28234 RepID=A0A1G6MYH5_9BACT|nr:dihydrodipicolinate reductase C-terminal domain-containing protein [Geotoga petraea]MDK2946727.1 4-hydroxy-tetrahydrodipicolinate reductase [Geotoga sp.]TGG87307.1 4-hydroxy-tetrahydrodipicolinate reductase [Geotoga petraea]SDC60247.1 dihydrodipicolinate reductase [Geotoga petraea]
MKYGLIGYSGKMGKAIKELFDKNGHKLVYWKDSEKEEEIEKPEIIIDFSIKSAFLETLRIIEEKEVPLIIGTTGLDENDFEKLREISKKVPVIQSFNFSIGINIMTELLKKMNDFIDDSYDIEITETHHRFKKDKPSGTAILLKNIIDKEVEEIHSKRLGSEFGEHEIEFATTGEIIKLTHRAYSREAFTKGVLLSAKRINNLENGLYTFKEILMR